MIQPVESLRDGIGRGFMVLCALAACYAFVQGMSAAVPAESGWLALWQSWGFAMFAALFALLALRPRASPGLWELALFHKAVLGIAGISSAHLPGALEAGSADAVLAGILAVAYWLTRGWKGWHRG